MGNQVSSNAFVLTGDEPIESQTFKRLLLTHNRIYFSDVIDEAIVNDREVIESFPKMKVGWVAKGHYPRVEGYKERYYRCLKGAESAINRSLLQPLASQNFKLIDPGTHWMCYSASLSNDDLVKAASIDASMEKPDIVVPNTVFWGLEISPSGMKSKYAVDYKPPIDMPNIHEHWNLIARIRVGRALKSIRISQALNASPIAIDSINSEICYSLMQKDSPVAFSSESMMDFVIDTEIIDNQKLEEILKDFSWEDVLKIRKEILPAVSKTRMYLSKETGHISKQGITRPDQYIEALNKFKTEFTNLKEQESDAWESLRIGAILKTGGTVGGLGLGSIAIPSLVSFPTSMIGLVSAGLVSTAALNSEIQKLIPARKKVKEHPLYLIEKLKRGEKRY